MYCINMIYLSSVLNYSPSNFPVYFSTYVTLYSSCCLWAEGKVKFWCAPLRVSSPFFSNELASIHLHMLFCGAEAGTSGAIDRYYWFLYYSYMDGIPTKTLLLLIPHLNPLDFRDSRVGPIVTNSLVFNGWSGFLWV